MRKTEKPQKRPPTAAHALTDADIGPHLSDQPDEIITTGTVNVGMHQVWTLAVCMAILQIGFGIVIPIFPYYILSMNLGGMELGILAAAYAMAQILLAGPLGHLSDRTGRKPVLVTAMLGFAAANVLYSLANDVYVMIIARIIEGAVSAGFFPAANAFVADVTAASTRGKAMGFLSAGGMVGFIIGPTLGGVLAEFFGLRLPFVITAFITLVTLAALHLLITEPDHQRDSAHNEGVHVFDIGLPLYLRGGMDRIDNGEIGTMKQELQEQGAAGEGLREECPHCHALYFYNLHLIRPDWTVACQNCGRDFKLRGTLPVG